MTTTMQNHRVVSQTEWLAARKSLLAKEKAFTRERDELSRDRRELPWVKVEKNYVFTTSEGSMTLAQLFGPKSQLIVYHFMMGPGWEEGCPGCSFLMDHLDGMLPHLNARDVSFVAVSRATLPEIDKFKRRMGWKFPWVSSNGSDFNFDYHVSFTKEQIAAGEVNYNYQSGGAPAEESPGASAFYKKESGELFHTYSCYARGLDQMLGAYNYLDIAPKGRDEEALASKMSWVRHHDRYGAGYTVDATALYEPPKGSICSEEERL